MPLCTSLVIHSRSHAPLSSIRPLPVSVSFLQYPISSFLIRAFKSVQQTPNSTKTLNPFSIMKTLCGILGLVAGTNALIAERWTPCCFHVSASGAVTGTIGQLDDGQNRQGGGLSPAQYCIANGAITDASGRGCILTRTSYYFSLIGVFMLTQSQLPQHNGNVTPGHPRLVAFPLAVTVPSHITG
jgi:hypothetical protein